VVSVVSFVYSRACGARKNLLYVTAPKIKMCDCCADSWSTRMRAQSCVTLGQ
jgi:hypothetical protein